MFGAIRQQAINWANIKGAMRFGTFKSIDFKKNW